MSVRNFENNCAPGTNCKGLPHQETEAFIGEVLTDEVFKAACQVAEVEVTNRQASKYRNGSGLAYAARTAFGAEGLLKMAQEG